MKSPKSFFTDTNILLVLGFAVFLLHMFTNHQYGFHQDEMVVMDNAYHLDWGFVEYPPLTPLLARLEVTLFGFSLVSTRTFPALVHALVIVLAGLMARELGGRRPAQIVAALAAAIVWQGWLDKLSASNVRLVMGTTWGLIGIGALFSGALSLPIAPVNSPLWDITSEVHDIFIEQIGWDEMVQTVAEIYAGLPEEEIAITGILAGENDEAAALNLCGGEFGLPKAVSGSDTFYLRGYGNPPPETLIVVGFTERNARSMFNECTHAGTITNEYGVENDLRDPPGIFVCRDPLLPWDELWRRLKRYS